MLERENYLSCAHEREKERRRKEREENARGREEKRGELKKIFCVTREKEK